MTAVLLWVNLQVFYYLGTGGKREKGEGMGGREVGERGWGEGERRKEGDGGRREGQGIGTHNVPL